MKFKIQEHVYWNDIRCRIIEGVSFKGGVTYKIQNMDGWFRYVEERELKGCVK